MIKERMSEPSTWGGIGLLLMAANQIFDINEAGEVGEAISEASQTGDIGITVTAGLMALAGIFMSEKKK